jgi:DNA-binding CsgD family transcriptional regulator
MGNRDQDGLTPREREVLDLVRLGLTNEEIAERLGITLDGAKYHVSQILSKLGVETREEAAALTAEPERRRWWAALPLAAKAAGAALVVAAVAALGVLAWGVWETEGDEAPSQAEQVTATPDDSPLEPFSSPTSGTATAGLPVTDTFEDTREFRAFAAELAQAIGTANLQWIVDHTRLEHDCAELILMSLPEECDPPGSTASGALIGFLNTDSGSVVERDVYRSTVNQFLTESLPAETDGYGLGMPRFYSFGLLASQPDGDTVEAVATSISDAPPQPIAFERPRRLLMLLHLAYEDQRWVIQSVSFGGGDADFALFLDARGAGTEVATSHPFWYYWERWEPSSITGRPAAVPAVRPCRAEDLFAVYANENAQTQLALSGFGIANRSRQACRLEGPPSIVLVGASGNEIPTSTSIGAPCLRVNDFPCLAMGPAILRPNSTEIPFRKLESGQALLTVAWRSHDGAFDCGSPRAIKLRFVLAGGGSLEADVPDGLGMAPCNGDIQIRDFKVFGSGDSSSANP